MNWKSLFSAFLPIVVLLLYSLIAHVDILLALSKINIIVILAFIASYLGQTLIIAIRDSILVKVSIKNAFKARLFGNAVSLIIPGWIGQELARAIVYTKGGKKLPDAFSLSILEGFFDVVTGSLLFLAILPLNLYILEFLYVLVAVGNIIGWGIGIAYVYSTAGKHVSFEKGVLRLIKIDRYYFLLLRGKDVIKNSLNAKYIFSYFTLTLLSYLVFSFAVFYLIPNYLYDILVIMTYFVSSLLPIPGAAGVSELALTLLLPSSYVFDIIILIYVCYSIGFAFVGEVSLNELKKEMKQIIEDGKFYQDTAS